MSTSNHSDEDKKAFAPVENEHHDIDADKSAFHKLAEHRRSSTGVTTDDVNNPLSGLSKEQVLAEADAFIKQYGFEDDREVFEKAALVAQRPAHTDGIADLTPDEKELLNFERNHPWRSMPGLLVYSVVMCAIGAACQGWDQTGSNGANLSFPQEFGIGAKLDEPNGQRDEWIVGLVNSSVYISAAFIGCWISDPLNELFGRRGEIFITGVILIITPIASGLTKSWEALMAVRLIMGIGVGAKAATVPMYCAELSPARIRGALTMGWQLWTAFGIFLGFCANAAVKDTGSRAWRYQLGSAFIPAVPLTFGVFFCPESPRWYLKKGRLPDAWRAMQRLRKTRLQAARDLFYAYVLFTEEQKVVRGRTYVTRLTELFTIPRCRRATLAAGVVMLGQQMCGINIMSFYSSTIFKENGSTDVEALYASIGFGALNFVFAIPAVFTIDTFGRRSLLLSTFPNMCWTLLVAGMCFFIDQDQEVSKARTALVATFIYLFTIAYSIGEGPVPFMYCAEVFPLAQREQGMALSVAWNNLWGAALALTFPRLLRALTSAGAFGFYAGLNMIAFIWIYLWVPETKQLTLEELDQVFSVPTRTFTKYQVGTVLPWWFRRYVLFQKDAYCPPLVYEKESYLA